LPHRQGSGLFRLFLGELDIRIHDLEGNFVALDIGNAGLEVLPNFEAGLGRSCCIFNLGLSLLLFS